MNMTYNPPTYRYNAGLNENAPAFDGKTVFYMGNHNVWCRNGLLPGDVIPPYPNLTFLDIPCSAAQTGVKVPFNGTLVAIDATSGNIKWSKVFPGIGIRGAVTVTGGLLFVG